MRKTIVAALSLVLILALSSFAAPPANRTSDSFTVGKVAEIDNTTFIDANRIFMFVTNHGNFGRDLSDYFGYDYGTFFPFSTISAISQGISKNGPLYASGLWIGAKDSATGDIRIAIAEYSDEYVPGPMSNGTFVADNARFKVYKLYSDSMLANPNSDWTNFPYQDGAPSKYYYTAYDAGGDPTDSVIGPDMIGDQMLWAVYNDANPAQHTNDAGETDPLGIEVRQTTFAFDREGSLGNIIAFKLQIFNKGNNTLDSCFFSLWADPDLGGAGDDLVGCDTNLSVGYCYNGADVDADYGVEVPCIGYDFFQGPLRAADPANDPIIGYIEDTVTVDPLVIDSTPFYGKMWGTNWTDSTNLGMYSFNKYINGTDPDDYNQTYNYMRGLEREGTPYVYSGDTLRYFHTGTPAPGGGTGDIDTEPADRRLMLSTGPVTFRPGDSTEIVAAIIVGQGSDRWASIDVMKDLDKFAQRLYESDFNPPKPPVKPDLKYSQLDEETVLYWNDTSEVDHGDYIFEGYTVWQGTTPSGPWTELATYDVINDRVDALIDTVANGNITLPVIKREITNSGIKRYFPIKNDVTTGASLRNGKEYYFRVSAFSFAYYLPDSSRVPNGDRFLESASVITVVPGESAPNVTTHSGAQDTLAVTHVGGNDGVVYPIVINPLELTGDDYRVTFSIDATLGTVWHLVDITTGDTLLTNETNQTGDEDYEIVDGLLVKVIGPSEGVKEILEIANGDGVLATPDNVMYSLNSTGDWYVASDAGSDFSRMNWRGHIGTFDWEARFEAGGFEYYDWNTDLVQADRSPFNFWNIGIATPDDTSDDMEIFFSFIDDDVSGAWSWGDRLYPWDVAYTEPAPEPPTYVWDDDFHIGRITFQDYSGNLTAPAVGTIIRFNTYKISTPADSFSFSTSAPTVVTSGQEVMDGINVVPNPFYMYRDNDPAHTREIMFRNLPGTCSITIYNLAGDLIRTLDKTDATVPYLYWNVTTDRGLPLASGIYIYVVEAPGFGTKVGKMAIFTGEEILDVF